MVLHLGFDQWISREEIILFIPSTYKVPGQPERPGTALLLDSGEWVHSPLVSLTLKDRFQEKLF